MVTTLEVDNLVNFFASPKSAIFRIPSSLIKMLDGFKSR